MSNRKVKQIRRTTRNILADSRELAINDWCNYVNKQKLLRRIKLAFLVIGGKITYEKIDKI